MELDEKTLKGFWSNDVNKGIDFFIINDAVFSKLCILGEDVEPCFEGAMVTGPEISSQFSMDNEFTKNLFTMMEELKFALSNNKGGEPMPGLEQNTMVEVEEVVEEVATEFAEDVVAEEAASVEPEVQAEEVEAAAEVIEETSEVPEEILMNSKKEEDEEEKSDSENSEDNTEDKEEEEDKKKKYSLLESELADLKDKFALLEEENKGLREFKQNVENEKKDELIASFYMLSDEDKKDVVENKALYTLDEIEAKLSVICVRNRVSFAKEEEEKSNVVTTFNLNSLDMEEDIPEWLREVRKTRDSR